MSIIYDALKKVEASGANDSKTKIDKGFKPKPKIYFLYALVICFGFFIANIFYEWLFPKLSLKTANIVTKGQPPTDKEQAVSSYSQPSSEAATSQTSAPMQTKIETQKETPPSLTLNGVFFSGNEGYALINNRIVKQGDKIGGATIVQISLDEVDLEFDGSIIKLSDSASNSTK
ncbi:MAG: hypothetical protein Q8N72_01675 [Candidatus Omnitrophota bacterium]|nr:hypothetical protein [Candidatus Omnitrophota bacterium]